MYLPWHMFWSWKMPFGKMRVQDSLPLEEALANAPDRQRNSFAVPKII